VVQRYGAEIIGGAEYHCRLVAEKLKSTHSVEIATTCSMDYLTWDNSFPAGESEENGIPVHRFRVQRPRPPDFDVYAHKILNGYSSLSEQQRYVELHGPYCPDLTGYLDSRDDVDRFIMFSYRYWTTWQALKTVGSRAILVPTAEHDKAVGLDIYRSAFSYPAAIAFNSVEERELIEYVTSGNPAPGEVVGVGIANPVPVDSNAVLAKYDLTDPYCLYIGRFEQSKGCMDLLNHYLSYFRQNDIVPDLVLVGKSVLAVPDHAGVRYLGVLSEPEKQAILERALFLVMPSRFESLSMVLLEAWRAGIPVICNGKCDVLRGQCRRSNGGLYYRNADEFAQCMDLLAVRTDLRRKLGSQGRQYYEKNYNWDVIIEKYNRLMKIGGSEKL